MTTQTLAESLLPSDPINELQTHYLGVLCGDCDRHLFIPLFFKELKRLLGIDLIPASEIYNDSITFTINGWYVIMLLPDKHTELTQEVICPQFTMKGKERTITHDNVSELIDTLNNV